MIITIFAKRRQTNEGKTFYTYLTTLVNNKDGSEVPCQVKFREDAGQPKADKCPMNIEFEQHEANLSKRQYTNEETGEIKTSYTLWVSKWREGPVYVDKSLDDYV